MEGGSGIALPNQTVYINNLNDKVKKQDLRRALYALFSQFGPVLDVVALKTTRMRGQVLATCSAAVSRPARSVTGGLCVARCRRT